MFHRIVIAFSFAFFVSCASSSSSNESEQTGTPGESSAPERQVIQDFFGVDGSIYKPVSDPEASGRGNLVILLSSKYTEQMDSCSIPLATGETGGLYCINTEPWTQVPFSCFSNGNRQTWRANFKCSAVGEVVVTCFRGEQEYRFEAPGGAIGNVCTRFG